MDYEKVKGLLGKYFEGSTSIEEEEILREVFNGKEGVPDEISYARIFFQSITEERSINRPLKALKSKRKVLLFWSSVAASLLFLSGLLWNISQPLVHEITKTNERQNPKKVKIQEGVYAWLNKGTSISYDRVNISEELEVRLAGEAYFEFSGNTPFSVIHESVKVACVAPSSFNINAKSNLEHVVITVEKGVVNVSEPNSKVVMALLLTEKNYCSINKKHKLMLSAANTNENYLAWKTGELVFDNEPMAMVADVLYQYYDVRVLFENKQLAYCEYTGQFKNKSLQQVIKGIQTNLPIAYQELPDGIMLMGESCKNE